VRFVAFTNNLKFLAFLAWYQLEIIHFVNVKADPDI
jgi:hypothetical protein